MTKRTKLKPGRCWALRMDEENAAQVVMDKIEDGNFILTFRTKKEAVTYRRHFPAWERPELIRLEVRQV